MSFAENVRKRRKELGLTQAEAAARVHLHYTMYSRYERGITDPQLSMVENFARALETRPEVLAGWDFPMPKPE